jgi:Ca2+-binding RTX toxin-like protein
MVVDATDLDSAHGATFDGSAVSNGGHFNIVGGAGGDTLLGGSSDDIINGGGGDDTITGGNGQDSLTGGLGSDTFVYAAPSESTSTSYDKIKDFDFSTDHFHLSGYFVNAIDTAVTTGALGPVAFDANLTAAVGSGQLAAHDAVLFTASSGSLSGHTYLVVDLNGTAGYQSGQDLVIEVTGYTNGGSFSTSTFS